MTARDDRDLEAALRAARPEFETPPYLAARVLEAAARTPRRRRMNWRLAAALAVVVVMLPLGGMAVWRHRKPAQVPRTASPAPRQDAVEPPLETYGIRTVRTRGTSTTDGRTYPDETMIEFPDKVRSDFGFVVSIQNGDRRLTIRSDPFAVPWHRTPYRYGLSRVPKGLRIGAAQFVAAGQIPPGRHQLSTERGPDGRVWQVVSWEVPGVGAHSNTAETVKFIADPHTDRLLAKEEASTWTEDGKRHVSRLVWDSFEYNIELPPDAFNTEPPPGAEVLDWYHPEAIKANYEEILAALARHPQSERAALVEEWGGKRLFEDLGQLPERDQEEVRDELKALGVDQ